MVVGRIGAPYGVRGWVRVTSYTDPPTNLGQYQPWLVAGQSWQPEQIRPHQAGFVAQLPGVNDRDAAARLAGQDIRITASQLPDPQADEYYWHDLIGMTVFDPAGRQLGKVVQMLETGVHDVLVIGVADAQEVLVPFVRKFVQLVDNKNKKLIVDWPELSLD